jgi:glycosyltransferase involved in cell wall biosynthesis
MQSLPLELAIVVPTFNEKANIDELVNRLGRV